MLNHLLSMINQQLVQDSILALLVERMGEVEGREKFESLPDTFFISQLEQLAILADDISEQRNVATADAEQEAIERWAMGVVDSNNWAAAQAS